MKRLALSNCSAICFCQTQSFFLPAAVFKGETSSLLVTGTQTVQHVGANLK